MGFYESLPRSVLLLARYRSIPGAIYGASQVSVANPSSMNDLTPGL